MRQDELILVVAAIILVGLIFYVYRKIYVPVVPEVSSRFRGPVVSPEYMKKKKILASRAGGGEGVGKGGEGTGDGSGGDFLPIPGNQPKDLGDQFKKIDSTLCSRMAVTDDCNCSGEKLCLEQS